MKGQRSLSGRCYMWSATGAEQAYHRLSTTTQHTPASSPLVCPFARLGHRTRQAGLQVCSELRPEGLSVSKPHWRPDEEGLCAPGRRGAGSPVLDPRLPYTRDPRRALRHQSQALASPRNAVSQGDGHSRHTAQRHLRSRRGGDARGQHARRMARSRCLPCGLRNNHR